MNRSMLTIPKWKLYAFVDGGRYVMTVEDACHHAPWDDVPFALLYFYFKPSLILVVSGITDTDDGSYTLHSFDHSDVLVGEGTKLRCCDGTLRPQRMTIHEDNLWIMESLGLYEGSRVSATHDRAMPDGETVVPVGAIGIVAQIQRNGALTIHWGKYGTEWDCDPNGFDMEDGRYQPPPYTVVLRRDEEYDLMKQALQILLSGAETKSGGTTTIMRHMTEDADKQTILKARALISRKDEQ